MGLAGREWQIGVDVLGADVRLSLILLFLAYLCLSMPVLGLNSHISQELAETECWVLRWPVKFVFLKV